MFIAMAFKAPTWWVLSLIFIPFLIFILIFITGFSLALNANMEITDHPMKKLMITNFKL